MDELYLDLPGDTTSSLIVKLETENETFISRIRELEKLVITHENNVEDLQKRLDKKERENQILRTNSSSLYLTAKAQLDRNEKQIEEYRRLIVEKDKQIEKYRQSSFRSQRCREYRSDRLQDIRSTKKSEDRYFSSIQKEDVIQTEEYEDSRRYCDGRPKHVPRREESKEELPVSRISDKSDRVESRNRRSSNIVVMNDKKNRDNSYDRSTNMGIENIKKNRKDSPDSIKFRSDKSENIVNTDDRRNHKDFAVRRKSRNARSPITSSVKTSNLKKSSDHNKFRDNRSAETSSANDRNNSEDLNSCIKFSRKRSRYETTNERQICEDLSNQIKCTGDKLANTTITNHKNDSKDLNTSDELPGKRSCDKTRSERQMCQDSFNRIKCIGDKSANTIITNHRNNSKGLNACDEFSGKGLRDKTMKKRQICEDLPNQIKCADDKPVITIDNLNNSKNLNACGEFSGKRSNDKIMDGKRIQEDSSNHVKCTVDKSASAVVTNNKKDQKDSSNRITLYADEYTNFVITDESPIGEDMTVFVEPCGPESPNLTTANKNSLKNSSEQLKFHANESTISAIDCSDSEDPSICNEKSRDVTTGGRQICEDSSDQLKVTGEKSVNTVVNDESEPENSTDSVKFCDLRSSNVVTTSVKISSVSLIMNGNKKGDEFTSVCKVTSTDDVEHGVFKRKRKRIS